MMKKYLLIIPIVTLAIGYSNAQFINDYGFSIHGSVTNALIKNPLIPEDGTFAYDGIKSRGFGLFANHKLNERLLVESRLQYLTKGFSSTRQSPPLGSIKTDYKFKYISLDGIIKSTYNKFYLLGGLRINKKISTYYPTQSGSGIDITTGQVINYYTVKVVEIDNPHSIEKINLEEFKKVNTSILFGSGLSMGDLVDAEIMVDYDLTPSYESSDTSLKHLAWTLRLAFNIGSLFNSNS
ncbi:MAG: hypothetical protein OCD76_05775 [Reichenbachiella sp.]